MKTIYKSEWGQAAPRELQAEIPSYPNRDSEGNVIYENTHFTDLGRAWKRHMREHEAAVELMVRQVKHTRQQAADAEKELVNAELKLHAAKESYQQWVEQQSMVSVEADRAKGATE